MKKVAQTTEWLAPPVLDTTAINILREHCSVTFFSPISFYTRTLRREGKGSEIRRGEVLGTRIKDNTRNDHGRGEVNSTETRQDTNVIQKQKAHTKINY